MEQLTTLALACALALTAAAPPQAHEHPQSDPAQAAPNAWEPAGIDPFHQGPERVGRTVYVSGRVIGLRDDCHLVLADRPGAAWRGLGGGGRFFYCSDEVGPGQMVEGAVEQVGTRRARVGPRWRVLPVYRPAHTTNSP